MPVGVWLRLSQKGFIAQELWLNALEVKAQ